MKKTSIKLIIGLVVVAVVGGAVVFGGSDLFKGAIIPVPSPIQCPKPYHVLTTDNRCVWSCSVGTQPNNTNNECTCQEGFIATSKDAFGRRVCVKSPDYNKNHFKMAFILVAKNSSELTSSRLSKLTSIKQYFASDFNTATSNLGFMDTSYNVVTMVDDGTLFDPLYGNGNENAVDETKIGKKFYQNNPDDFDFISVFTTFQTGRNQDHELVNNNVNGIGIAISNSSATYGTKGRLKGINHMGFIDNYDPNPTIFRSSGLLHETGHQWCCYVGDTYIAPGPDLPNLPILDSGIHWHVALMVNDLNSNQRDPMNGGYWIDNRDGTFTRKDVEPQVTKYHPLTLYLMGLVTKDQVPLIKLILPKQVPQNNWQWYEPIEATFKYITIGDIIARYGERSEQQNQRLHEIHDKFHK